MLKPRIKAGILAPDMLKTGMSVIIPTMVVCRRAEYIVQYGISSIYLRQALILFIMDHYHIRIVAYLLTSEQSPIRFYSYDWADP